MTRIVLEEIFRDGVNPETGDPIKLKMGEVVIYIQDLEPNFITALKNDTTDKMKWPEKYRTVLRKEGYDV